MPMEVKIYICPLIYFLFLYLYFNFSLKFLMLLVQGGSVSDGVQSPLPISLHV